MYRVGTTDIPGMSFRPFSQRLGDYQRFDFTIPTATTRSGLSIAYGNQPVTGRLGQDSVFSGVASSPLFWIAALAGGYFLFTRKRG